MKKDNKSSVLSLVLVLAIVAVGIFWFKPNWDDQSALKLTEQARENDKQAAEATLKALQDAQANLAGTSEINQETVLTAIPERLEQNTLIDQITKIASQNQVNLSSISFAIPLNSTQQLKTVTINLSMAGNENDLLHMLQGLENNPRKLVVNSVTVQFGQTEGVKRVNFNISAEAYYQTVI